MNAVFAFALLVSSATSILPTQETDQQPTSTPLWTFRAEDDIKYVRSAAFDVDIAFVGTEDELITLDRETGELLWTRDDIDVIISAFLHPEDPDAPGQPVAERVTLVVADDKRVALVRVAGGERLWDSRDSPFKEVQGFLAVSERGYLILYGKTEESDATLIAVNAETGSQMWRNDELFDKRPEHARGLDRPLRLIGHQAPVLDTDSTVILYISKDGPIRIHLERGELLWRASVLRDRDVPMPRRGYAPFEVMGGEILVPFDDKRLAALNRETGEVVWQTKLRERPGTLEVTAHGVILGSLPLDKYLDMLDPASGESAWPEPLRDLKNATNARVRDDTLYVVADGTLRAVDIPSGRSRELAEIEFEGGERPDFVYADEDGLVLVSFHNVMRLGFDGEQRFHRFLPRPGRGLSGLLQQAAGTDQPTQPTGISDDHVFIFTDAPDSTGREGYSVVKISKATGEEEGRIWFEEKTPDYNIHSDAGIIYLYVDDREVAAYRF